MFQNITDKDQVDSNKKSKINFRNLFKAGDIVLYILSFMISTVGFNEGLAPFGMAMFAALCANRTPVGFAYIAILLGTFMGFGVSGALAFFLTSIVFVLLILIFKPIIYDTERNEKQKLRNICFYFYNFSTSSKIIHIRIFTI